MQMEAAEVRQRALKEIGPYLLYADRMALSEGRTAEVAARVAKRIRRWRTFTMLGLGFVVFHNLVLLLWADPGPWYDGVADLLSVVTMGWALAIVCFLYPRDRRLLASIERGLFSEKPLPGAASERPS